MWHEVSKTQCLHFLDPRPRVIPSPWVTCFWQIEYEYNEGASLPWLSYERLWPHLSGSLAALMEPAAICGGEAPGWRNKGDPVNSRRGTEPSGNPVLQTTSLSVEDILFRLSPWMRPHPGHISTEAQTPAKPSWFPTNRNCETIICWLSHWVWGKLNSRRKPVAHTGLSEFLPCIVSQSGDVTPARSHSQEVVNLALEPTS